VLQAVQHIRLPADRREHGIGQLAVPLCSDRYQQGSLVLKMPVRRIVRDACLPSNLSQGERRSSGSYALEGATSV
jgi:hypothetical protein